MADNKLKFKTAKEFNEFLSRLPEANREKILEQLNEEKPSDSPVTPPVDPVKQEIDSRMEQVREEKTAMFREKGIIGETEELSDDLIKTLMGVPTTESMAAIDDLVRAAENRMATYDDYVAETYKKANEHLREQGVISEDETYTPEQIRELVGFKERTTEIMTEGEKETITEKTIENTAEKIVEKVFQKEQGKKQKEEKERKSLSLEDLQQELVALERRRLEGVSDVAAKREEAVIGEPKKKGAKQYLKNVARGFFMGEEYADKKERQAKEAQLEKNKLDKFVEIEQSFNPTATREELESKYNRQNEITKQLEEKDKEISEYSKLGVGDEDLKQTRAYKEKIALSKEMAEMGTKTFSQFAKKSDKEQYYEDLQSKLQPTEEEKTEAEVDAQENLEVLKEQTEISGEQLELFKEETEKNDVFRTAMLAALAGGVLSGNNTPSVDIDLPGSKSKKPGLLSRAGNAIKSAGKGAMGGLTKLGGLSGGGAAMGAATLAAGAAAGYGVYQAGQAVLTGRSDVGDWFKKNVYDSGKVTDSEKEATKKADIEKLEKLNVERQAQGKKPLDIDYETGMVKSGVSSITAAPTAIDKKTGKETSLTPTNEVSQVSTTPTGPAASSVVPEPISPVGQTKPMLQSSAKLAESTDPLIGAAETIGKNIKVNVPAPIVQNAGGGGKDRVVSTPFSQRIKNQEPSISTYIRERYLP